MSSPVLCLGSTFADAHWHGIVHLCLAEARSLKIYSAPLVGQQSQQSETETQGTSHHTASGLHHRGTVEPYIEVYPTTCIYSLTRVLTRDMFVYILAKEVCKRKD